MACSVLAVPFISPCSQVARWRPQGRIASDQLSRSGAFRIVGKLRGNLFIADQSRAASHSPSHYTLLAPRASHLAFYPDPEVPHPNPDPTPKSDPSLYPDPNAISNFNSKLILTPILDYYCKFLARNL